MSTLDGISLPDNPVRRSVSSAVQNLRYVAIDEEEIDALAGRLGTEEFPLPEWRAPVFPDTTEREVSSEDVIDFFFVGNSINYQFRDYETGDKFTAEYAGKEWSGAFAMWACLKREFDENPAILRGKTLAGLSIEDVSQLFEPADGTTIPMLEERHRSLQDVGHNLEERYGGRFANLVKSSEPRLYADGNGILDKLTTDFRSFSDSAVVELPAGPVEVVFWKRAQLAPGMAYARFQNTDDFVIEDEPAFTVFVDYNLPNVLRELDILEYSPRLSSLVDNRQPIEPGSRKEVEIRAATLYAADQLIERVNTRRDSPIFAPHMDYKLFTIRDRVSKPVHITRTTAY